MKRFSYWGLLIALSLCGLYAGSAFAGPIAAQCTGTTRYSGSCFSGLAQDGVTAVDCLIGGCIIPSCQVTDSGQCPAVTYTCYGGAYEQGSGCADVDYLETQCSSDIQSCNRNP